MLHFNINRGNMMKLARNLAKTCIKKSLITSPGLQFSCIQRSYHTYPDPEDKGSITLAKSEVQKSINKSDIRFTVDDRFRLDKAFPGVPKGSGIALNSYPITHSTKLKNGITVASQDTSALMSSFAVLIGSGSADELQVADHPDSTFGAVHAIELTSFRDTTSRTHDEVSKGIEKLGGIAQCVSNRESILYCVDVLRENSEIALDILADCVINALYSEANIEDAKKVMMYQQDELPSDLLSRDAVMIAGYKGSPLSNHHLCPPDVIDKINIDVIKRFRARYFVGENIVISGVGIDHESFIKIIEKKFESVTSIGERAYQDLKSQRKPSLYTGGMVKNERALKEPFIKIAVGFEIGGWNDKDFVASCVLQQLLGGGSSFSAGGPGKGMYTRLYSRVLNQYHWVENAEAFVSINNESGIFGIDGACPPEYATSFVQVALEHLVNLAFEQVTDEELNRAKNMLRSMMLMQLESRLVICEDICRQISTYGHREMPNEVSKKISVVTKADLQNVARRMLKTPLVIGCVGSDLSQVPAYSDISNALEPVKQVLNK